MMIPRLIDGETLILTYTEKDVLAIYEFRKEKQLLRREYKLSLMLFSDGHLQEELERFVEQSRQYVRDRSCNKCRQFLSEEQLASGFKYCSDACADAYSRVGD